MADDYLLMKDATVVDYPHIYNIIEGLKIIQKYDPATRLHFEHDELMCPIPEKKMSPEDSAKLFDLNWILDENCWTHF